MVSEWIIVQVPWPDTVIHAQAGHHGAAVTIPFVFTFNVTVYVSASVLHVLSHAHGHHHVCSMQASGQLFNGFSCITVVWSHGTF